MCPNTPTVTEIFGFHGNGVGKRGYDSFQHAQLLLLKPKDEWERSECVNVPGRGGRHGHAN